MYGTVRHSTSHDTEELRGYSFGVMRQWLKNLNIFQVRDTLELGGPPT